MKQRGRHRKIGCGERNSEDQSELPGDVSRRDFLRRAMLTGGVVGTITLAGQANATTSLRMQAAEAGTVLGKGGQNGTGSSGAKSGSIRVSERVDIAVHLNQVGYLPHELKRAVVAVHGSPEFLARFATSGFAIVDEDVTPRVRHHASLLPYRATKSGGVDLNRTGERVETGYGHYDTHFIAEFDGLRRAGRYRVRLSNGLLSAPFSIATGRELYARLIPLTLNFFDMQRCGILNGSAVADCHGTCHPDDGRIVGGPRDGQRLDASGGWHDAGDYMKFVETTSYVTALMLFTFDMFPALRAHLPSVTPSASPVFRRPLPPLLAQARVGLEWLLKMHPSPQEFYYQVGDDSDHDVWRLPEHDCCAHKADWVPRPVYFGVGANLAGRCAAAFALGARLYAAYDQPFAHRCYDAAQSVYQLGLANPQVKSTLPSDFYPERSWEDDMAWGGAELYRATHNRKYLEQAMAFAHRAGAAGEATSVYHTHALAHYTLLSLVGKGDEKEKTDRERLREYLRQDAELAYRHSANPYGLATPYIWGTAEAAVGAAINCLLYARSLNQPLDSQQGDLALYEGIARQQRDFILGCNPFNVSFLIGAGSHYPLYPHHPVANIRQTELTGALVGGPGSVEAVRDQNIDLDHWDVGQVPGPPPRSDMETEVAVYHDAVQDFVTNEPAIDYTAKFLLLAAFYSR